MADTAGSREHELTEGICRLGVHYLHRRVRMGATPDEVERLVETHTNIYEYTTCSIASGRYPWEDGPAVEGWSELVNGLSARVCDHAGDPSSVEAEDECLDFLAPYIFPEQEPPRPPSPEPQIPVIRAGCWRVGVVSDTEIDLHFWNAHRPDSPFDHLDELTADLKAVVVAGTEANPSVGTVSCTTWLNSTRRFPTVFPQSYAGTIEVIDEPTRRGLGWWGQYVTREGGFNRHTAARFRETGEHPYPMARGWCRPDEILCV